MNGKRRTIAALVLATVATVYPGFLVGALSVQIRDELVVTEKTFGWGLGSFFLAAAIGSRIFGRLAQRIGPKRQIMGALVTSIVVQLAIASFVDSFLFLALSLAAAGFANSANQTAVNLGLTQTKISRLGLAIATKQSAMPAASLICGLMVPAIALTVGWRWAYVAGLGLACLALGAIAMFVPEIETGLRQSRAAASPTSPTFDLVVAAAAGGFLAFGAGSLNAWLVESGVDAGLDPGASGLMLSVGAACGITLRLSAGFRLDRSQYRPFHMAAASASFGAIGLFALASRSVNVHVLATFLAFSGGWIWPAFTNFGIIRTNPDAAAAATGTTQVGVYIGVFTAPLITGWLIETQGYPTMWRLVALSMAIGAVLAALIGRRF